MQAGFAEVSDELSELLTQVIDYSHFLVMILFKGHYDVASTRETIGHSGRSRAYSTRMARTALVYPLTSLQQATARTRARPRSFLDILLLHLFSDRYSPLQAGLLRRQARQFLIRSSDQRVYFTAGEVDISMNKMMVLEIIARYLHER